MTRETDSSSSGAQGRGPAYPSGTPPYGTRPFPSLHPQEQPRPAEPAAQPAADEPPAKDGPKTETTLTTRIRINIPGSRPIPPVVLRTPVGDATAAAATASGTGTASGVPGTAAGAAPGSAPGAGTGSGAGSGSGAKAQASSAAAEPETAAEPAAEKKTSDWFAPRKPVAPHSPDAGRDTAAPPAPGTFSDPDTGAFIDPDTGAFSDSDSGAFSGSETGTSPYPPRHDTPAPGAPAFGTEDFPPGVPRPVDPFEADERAPEFPPPAGPTAGPVHGVMSIPPYGPGSRPTAGDGGHAAPGTDVPGPYGAGGPQPSQSSPESAGFAGTDRPGTGRLPGMGAGRTDADVPGPYGTGRPGGPRGDGFPAAAAGFAESRPGRPGPGAFGGPGGPGAPAGLSGRRPGAGGGPRGRDDTLVGGIPPVPAGEGPAPRTAPAAAAPAGKPAAAARPARKGRSKVVLLGVAVGTVAVIAYGAGLLMNHADVPKNTTVLGVQIGDMTKDQAVQTLDKALGARTTAPLTLTIGGRHQELKPSVAGLTFDADATVHAVAHTDYNPVSVISSLFGGTRTATPVIRVDNDKLKAALTGIAGRTSTGAEPMVKFTDHTAVPVPGRSGTSFDVDAAAGQVAAAYRTRAQTGADRPVALAVATAKPKVTQAELDRAVNGFGKTAMSGPVVVRADAAHQITFNKSLPTFLTMTADARGTLVPHVDLTVLKGLYGQTFQGVVLKRADGSTAAVTPQDVATALIQALGAADPAGRTVTLPHVVP